MGNFVRIASTAGTITACDGGAHPAPPIPNEAVRRLDTVSGREGQHGFERPPELSIQNDPPDNRTTPATTNQQPLRTPAGKKNIIPCCLVPRNRFPPANQRCRRGDFKAFAGYSHRNRARRDKLPAPAATKTTLDEFLSLCFHSNNQAGNIAVKPPTPDTPAKKAIKDTEVRRPRGAVNP